MILLGWHAHCFCKKEGFFKVPDKIYQKWEAWKSSLKGLEKICIRRCIKPEGFGIIKEASLHHFSDASEEGYGQSTYLRLVNVSGKIHCCLLMGKSRVTPKKYVTIPRLELVAAVLSVKIAALIRRELDIEWKNETFWTDSKVVLGYINNNTKKFKIFVANRIQQIHEGSKISQWRYVPSKMNPADDASRGLDANKNTSSSKWFKGPEFLWHNETSWPAERTEAITDEDPEVKHSLTVNRIAENYGMLSYLTERISDWKKLKKIVAIMIQYKQKLLKIIRQKRQYLNVEDYISEESYQDISMLQKAETEIIKMCQPKHFWKEIKEVNAGKRAPWTISIYQLDPFLDKDGVLRVGGRFVKSNLSHQLKHPVLVSKNCTISQLTIRYYHQNTALSGRGMAINKVGNGSYWIIN